MVNFRGLRSGQVWQQQRQEQHGTVERKRGKKGCSAGKATGFSVLSRFFHANAKHMHVRT